MRHPPQELPPARRTHVKRRELGRAGERRAWRYLRRQGLRLIARNWRCELGELDLIARQENTVVFIEVRSAGASRPFAGAPEHTVGPEKQRRLRRLARTWLQRSPWTPEGVRFDVVALERKGWLRWEIRHYPNAFDGD